MAQLQITITVVDDGTTVVLSETYEDTKSYTVATYRDGLQDAAKDRGVYVEGDNSATLLGLGEACYNQMRVWMRRWRRGNADLGDI